MWVTFFSNLLGYLITGIVGIVMLLLFSRSLRNFLYFLKIKNVERSIKILVISNEEECREACWLLRSHCKDLCALGFDCEWVSVNGERKPVALLQLASVHGLCCLFRLNVLGTVQMELDNLLRNSNIIKLGICPLNDSKFLKNDYNVKVNGTLDLRYLYPTGGGLAAMSASEIGVKLDKNWRVICSDWEAPELTDSQKDYAAKDAFVAIEIFKKWLLTNCKTFNLYQRNVKYDNIFTDDMKIELYQYLDIDFKSKHSKKLNETTIRPEGLTQKKVKSNYLTRKSPLYDNCYMHAPDGELLCSCNKRKAQWYVERGLAELLPGEPYSIRLLFEPAARADDATEKKFYQQLKQNCCVVCGAQESYLKHYIVPKEYRKHFPNIMKEHKSHDVVLMCVRCHHLASQYNEILRQKLATLCNAPTTSARVTQSRAIQQVKNCAKALINSADCIPTERKKYLELEVKRHFKVDTLTPELLSEAANLKSKIIYINKESHGSNVVKYFMEMEEGLQELEILWREYFVNTMEPRHLPVFWSVNHKNSKLVNAD